jgi:hypothetical protein
MIERDTQWYRTQTAKLWAATAELEAENAKLQAQIDAARSIVADHQACECSAADDIDAGRADA